MCFKTLDLMQVDLETINLTENSETREHALCPIKLYQQKTDNEWV